MDDFVTFFRGSDGMICICAMRNPNVEPPIHAFLCTYAPCPQGMPYHLIYGCSNVIRSLTYTSAQPLVEHLCLVASRSVIGRTLLCSGESKNNSCSYWSVAFLCSNMATSTFSRSLFLTAFLDVDLEGCVVLDYP